MLQLAGDRLQVREVPVRRPFEAVKQRVLRVWKRYALAGTAVSVFLFFLQIPGIKEDSETWSEWLDKVPWLSWVSAITDPIVSIGSLWMMIVALIIMIAANAPALASGVRELRTSGSISTAWLTHIDRGEKSERAEDRSGADSEHVDPEAGPNDDETGDHDEDEYESTYPQYGVDWRPRYIARHFLGPFSALNSMGLRPKSAVRVDGPYCTEDGTELQYRDYHGVRIVLEKDDVSGNEGTLVCTLCNSEYSIAPEYRGTLTLATVREQIRTRLDEG